MPTMTKRFLVCLAARRQFYAVAKQMSPLLLYSRERLRHSCVKASRNKYSHTMSSQVQITLGSSLDPVHLAT